MSEFYAGLIRGALVAIGVVMALSLGSCAKQAPEAAIAAAPYCAVANPVLVSRNDTRETKEQADREYAKWKALCAPKASAGTAAAAQ